MKLFCAWRMSILGCFCALWKGGSTYRSMVLVSCFSFCSVLSQQSACRAASVPFILQVWLASGRHTTHFHGTSSLRGARVLQPLCLPEATKASFCQNQFSPHPSSAPVRMLCTKPGLNQLCSPVPSSADIQASRQAWLHLIPPLFKTNTTTACRATAEPYPNFVCV